MRPIYETIDMAIDSSFKVATYKHTETCESSNWHIHPEYELVYIKNGIGTLRIDSKMIPYSDGALLFLGPNIAHADFGNKEHSNNLEVVIQFGKEFADEKLAVFPEFKMIKKMIHDSKRILLFDPTVKNKLSPAFERFDHIKESQRLIHFIYILEELARCTSYRTVLGEKGLASYKTSDVSRLETIFEYVNEHYYEVITTKILAQYVGLTTNSFCRFFKKMANKPFIQFVNEFRTRKAAELFNETTLSVSEVMYKCGYSDASYFTKQFKKNQGVTPSTYLISKR